MSHDLITVILLFTISICVIGLIAIFTWLLKINSQTKIKTRIDGFITPSFASELQFSDPLHPPTYSPVNRFEGVRGKINEALSFFSTERLRQKISSAYWPISDIEFIFIRLLATLIGIAVGWIIPNSIIGGIGLGILFYLVPGFILERAILNRRKKFQGQLLDFLVLIKGAVIAGYSLTQSLDLAIKESSPPISEEFSRVLREVKFGFPLDQALFNLSARMQSDDLQIVVTAIIINTQMGGNLSTILESTIDTIRERIHLFGEIRSLTAYARYVGVIISLLPFITALIVFLLNPGYFDTVKTSFITQMILLLALLGVIFGNYLIRRIMRIRI